MVEIPEHLRKRAAEARAKAEGRSSDKTAGDADSSDAPPASADTPPASGGDGETMTIDGTEVQTGAVQVTLQWNTPVDLDLYVTDPAGDTVSYQNTSVGSGGELDVDARRSCQTTPETVENIIWRANPPRGAYTVRVNYYTACDEGPASYTATLRRGGQVVDTWTGTLTIGESDDHTFSVE